MTIITIIHPSWAWVSPAEGGVSVLFLNTEPQGAEDTYHIHAVEGWPHPVSLTAPGQQPTRGGVGGGEQGGLYCSLFQGELCSCEGLQVMRRKGVPDRSSSRDYCSLPSQRLPEFSQARRSRLDPDSVGTGDPQDEVNAAKTEGRIWLWRVLKHLDSEELCAVRGWIYLCQIRFQEHREVLKCEADVLLKPTYSSSITPRGSAVR